MDPAEERASGASADNATVAVPASGEDVASPAAVPVVSEAAAAEGGDAGSASAAQQQDQAPAEVQAAGAPENGGEDAAMGTASAPPPVAPPAAAVCAEAVSVPDSQPAPDGPCDAEALPSSPGIAAPAVDAATDTQPAGNKEERAENGTHSSGTPAPTNDTAPTPAPTAPTPSPPAPSVSPEDWDLPDSLRGLVHAAAGLLATPERVGSVKADIAALAAKEADKAKSGGGGQHQAGGVAGTTAGRSASAASAAPAAAFHQPSVDPAVPCVPCVATLQLDALAMPVRNPLGLSDAASDAIRTVTGATAGATCTANSSDNTQVPHPGLSVAYELVGDAWRLLQNSGPDRPPVTVVVLVPGDCDAGAAMRDVAITLALRCRNTACLLYDRPNTGRSGLTWEGSRSEAHMQSDYLAVLLESHLQVTTPVVLYGRGLGGRLALLHALRYSHQVGALVLDTLPAGHKAAHALSRRLYTSLVDTASIYNKDGMLYVAKDPRFAECVAASEDSMAHLLRTPYEFFKLRMDTWAAPLGAGGDPAFFPALGVEQHRCHSIAAPVLVGCVTDGYGAEAIESNLTSTQHMAALNDCFIGAAASNTAVAAGADLAVWTESVVAFVAALPQPLPVVPLRTTAAAAASTLAGATRSWARTVFGTGSSPERDDQQQARESQGSVASATSSRRDHDAENGTAANDGPQRTCSSSSLSDMLTTAAAAVGYSPSKTAPGAATAAPEKTPALDDPPAAQSLSSKCVVQ
jgi:pimeloyl-ACP methyl ester carboxylesterase